MPIDTARLSIPHARAYKHRTPINTARLAIPRAYQYRAPINAPRLAIPYAYQYRTPINTPRLSIPHAYQYRTPLNTARLSIPVPINTPRLSIPHALVVPLLFVTAPSALADVDLVSARNIGSDGLHAIGWGIAAAGLFMGVGFAIGRRK